MTMKRITALLLAIFTICLTAYGCNRSNAAGDDTTTTTESTTNPWDILDGTKASEETTAEIEQTDATDAASTEDASVDVASADATTKTTKTTTAPPKSTAGTNKTTTTAKKTTTTAKTTTKATTTAAKTTTAAAGSNINPDSKDAALAAFNSAVSKAVSGKSGFGKRHSITYTGWNFDDSLLDGLNIPGFSNPVSYISDALNSALNNGVRTASNQKGNASQLIKNSTFTMSDMRDVAYSGSRGGDWTITLYVKDGETRKTNQASMTGSAPITKGPLNLATSGGTIHDHMNANRISTLIKGQLSLLSADPIDVSERTTGAKLVVKLDAKGRLKSITATYNQAINIREIKLLSRSFKDITGSSAVTVIYDSFVH